MNRYDSYVGLLNIKHNEYILFLILPLIFIILLILAFRIEAYDCYQTKYIYSENQFVLVVPIQYSDKITKSDYLILENTQYNYTVDSISFLEGNEYQEIIVNIPNSGLQVDNQVGTINFYYNKSKIINKIVNLLF